MEFKRKHTLKKGFSSAALSSVLFLVLLFFVVLGASLSQRAVSVNLPQASASEPALLDPVTVTVDAAGRYFVNDFEVPEALVEQNLLSLTEGMPHPGFTVRADRDARHQQVVFLYEIARKNRFAIAIATE